MLWVLVENYISNDLFKLDARILILSIWAVGEPYIYWDINHHKKYAIFVSHTMNEYKGSCSNCGWYKIDEKKPICSDEFHLELNIFWQIIWVCEFEECLMFRNQFAHLIWDILTFNYLFVISLFYFYLALYYCIFIYLLFQLCHDPLPCRLLAQEVSRSSRPLTLG